MGYLEEKEKFEAKWAARHAKPNAAQPGPVTIPPRSGPVHGSDPTAEQLAEFARYEVEKLQSSLRRLYFRRYGQFPKQSLFEWAAKILKHKVTKWEGFDEIDLRNLIAHISREIKGK